MDTKTCSRLIERMTTWELSKQATPRDILRPQASMERKMISLAPPLPFIDASESSSDDFLFHRIDIVMQDQLSPNRQYAGSLGLCLPTLHEWTAAGRAVCPQGGSCKARSSSKLIPTRKISSQVTIVCNGRVHRKYLMKAPKLHKRIPAREPCV